MHYIVSFLLPHWVHFSAADSKSPRGFIGVSLQYGDNFIFWKGQYARS